MSLGFHHLLLRYTAIPLPQPLLKGFLSDDSRAEFFNFGLVSTFFNFSALLTLGARSFSVAGAVLGLIGHRTGSLASVHYMLVAPALSPSSPLKLQQSAVSSDIAGCFPHLRTTALQGFFPSLAQVNQILAHTGLFYLCTAEAFTLYCHSSLKHTKLIRVNLNNFS